MYTAKLPKLFQPFHCDSLIRLGSANDSGYLVNLHDVVSSKKLLSFGIGTEISFEKDFYKLNPLPIVGFDKVINIDKTFFTDNKTVIAKHIGNEDTDEEVDIKTLLLEKDIFIKCDIEGSEYNILDEIINFSHNITGMAIEFHDVNKHENFDNLLNFVSKVNQKLVHVHVNNYFYFKTENGAIPDILELTFSSSNNITYDKNLILPNRLDAPNNPHDLDFKLIFS